MRRLGAVLGLLLAVLPHAAAAQEVRSGSAYISEETRAMQDDDFANPGMPTVGRGEKLFRATGQTGMACVHCHDDHAGQYLRGQRLSHGQSNGFPEYRLGSGKVTSLHGRFSECFHAFRAEPFEDGAPEYISLEVYLNARGNGLPIETPAVRY